MINTFAHPYMFFLLVPLALVLLRAWFKPVPALRVPSLRPFKAASKGKLSRINLRKLVPFLLYSIGGVMLIVALAGGLALVVLFTLANTNVSERVREMATLKVLGFFDREVHHYVNREMMILTVMGVILGLPLGRLVGGMLTMALNMPSLYFEVEVKPLSYVIAAVATMAFALLVQLFVNPVLDRIDPISSLKSVE